MRETMKTFFYIDGLQIHKAWLKSILKEGLIVIFECYTVIIFNLGSKYWKPTGLTGSCIG